MNPPSPLSFIHSPFIHLFHSPLKIAQSASVEYTDCFSAEGWDPPPPPPTSNDGALGNADHFFIAIAPRSTLAPELWHLIGSYLWVN